MIDPVLSDIRGEGKVSYRISVDFVVEVEEDAEAYARIVCARSGKM